jgi:tryptophan synthase alpha subunit
MTGVTGAAPTELSAAAHKAELLREQFGRPVVVGFGIDGPANARLAAGPAGGGADGVVVGTAIVKQIENGTSPEERLLRVRRFVSELREGLDRGL